MILVPSWLAAFYIGFNVGCVVTAASRQWHAEQKWRISRGDIIAAAITILVPLPLINLIAIAWKRRQKNARSSVLSANVKKNAFPVEMAKET